MKPTVYLIPAAIAAAVAAASPAAAANAPKESVLDSLKVVNVSFVKNADMMEVEYEFDLSAMSIGSNERVIFTPVFAGEGDSIVLQPLVLNGRNAQLKYEREKNQRVEGATVIQYKKNQTANWNGAASFPYEEWMEVSRLNVHEDLCGCGDLRVQACIPVGYEFDNRPAPAAVMTFIQPVVEATKARAEEGSAFIDFQVNKTNILPDYRNNRFEIRKITETIDLVKNDPLVSITNIDIHGYASPEGSYANNTRLAEGRALSLKNYVKSLYTLSDKLFTSSATPEDWAGLRRLVEKSTLADRKEILAVIDSDMEPDAKDAALRTRFPQSYQVMLSQMYPALRHSDYTVKYIVRPLTIEETIAVMRTDPKRASLQEMFLVAQTFDPGSPEFEECMDIAVRTYPDDPVANLNAGASALNAGNLDEAEAFLAKAGDSPEALQARGVLAMQRGDFDRAESLLNEALAAGVEDAEFNLTVLARARQLAAQNRGAVPQKPTTDTEEQPGL